MVRFFIKKLIEKNWCTYNFNIVFSVSKKFSKHQTWDYLLKLTEPLHPNLVYQLLRKVKAVIEFSGVMSSEK